MSQVAIKFVANATLAYRLRQAALARGTCVADVIRKCCEANVGAVTPAFDEALVERQRNDDGNVVVGAYLSKSLAGAVKQIAAETGQSQSRVLRHLIRTQLRIMGRWGSPSATLTNAAADAAPDNTADAAA